MRSSEGTSERKPICTREAGLIRTKIPGDGRHDGHTRRNGRGRLGIASYQIHSLTCDVCDFVFANPWFQTSRIVPKSMGTINVGEEDKGGVRA